VNFVAHHHYLAFDYVEYLIAGYLAAEKYVVQLLLLQVVDI